MNITINLHVDKSIPISAHILDTGTAVVQLDGGVNVFLDSPADADRLIKAAVEAKRLLLGETAPELGGDR